MTKHPRWRRYLTRAAGGLVLLVLLAPIAVKLFLLTPWGADVVAARLDSLLHTSVRIGSIDAAFFGDSALHAVSFRDQDGQPFFDIHRFDVDLSMWKALRGQRLPRRLDLHTAHLHLRFSREGRLLTRLPQFPASNRLPELHVHALQVTLAQEGRPPLTLENATASLAPREGDNLTGTLDDPTWGAFAVTGAFGQGKLHLVLRSEGVALTPAMVRAAPFLPLPVTRLLELEGPSVPLTIKLWFAKEAPKARYDVEFGPATARLLQPDRPHLAVRGARGRVTGTDRGFDFAGHIDDPHWGQWSVAAGLPAETKVVAIRVDSPDVAFDQAKLTAMPYVPAYIWRSVQGSGRARAAVAVRVAIDRPEVHYRVELAMRAATVRVAALDLTATDTTGEVVVDDNHVTLRSVCGKSASGVLRTSGDLDFRQVPMQLRFDLDVKNLTLTQLPASWDLPRQIEGRLSGEAKLDVRIRGGTAETTGRGTGRVEDAKLAGFATREPIQLELRAERGSLRIRPRGLLWDALNSFSQVRRWVPVIERLEQALGEVAGLPETTYLDASFALDGVDAATLAERLQRKFPVPVGGSITLEARVRAPVNYPRDLRDYRLDGRLDLRDVRAGAVRLPRVTAALDFVVGTLYVTDLRGTIGTGDNRDPVGRFFGVLALDAFPPPGRPGDLAVDLGLAGVPVASLRAFAPALPRQVNGALAGRVQAHAALDRLLDPAGWAGTAHLTAGLRLGTRDAIDVSSTATLRADAGTLTYHVRGRTISGRFDARGQYPAGGTVRLERIPLSKVWRALDLADRLGDLDGTVSLNLPFRHAGGLVPEATGTFELRDLRWRDREVTEVLRGDLRLSRTGLTLRDGNGLLAGGMLRLTGGYRFDDRTPGWVHLHLTGFDPSRFAALDPEYRNVLQGPVELTLRGTLGAECRASGQLALSRGKIAGVEVSDLRLPVECTLVPSAGRFEATIREAGAHLDHGRAQLRASLRYTGRWRVEGNLVIVDAGLRSLAGMLGDVSSFARGRVSGRIDFSGADLASPADLTATVQATLNDAQAFQLPLLRHLVPHVLPGQGAADFQAGQLRGRYANGIFRVSELTLDNALILLLAEGTITTKGRLDLEVTAQTSAPGLDPVVLRLMFQKLPLVGPVPLALLVRATEILSARIVHLRVGGTIRAPHIQVEPVRVLSEQAVRYFLTRAARAVG